MCVCVMICSDEDLEVDVVNTGPQPPLPYDINKARNVMYECERHGNLVRLEEGADDWEDKVTRCGTFTCTGCGYCIITWPGWTSDLKKKNSPARHLFAFQDWLDHAAEQTFQQSDESSAGGSVGKAHL